MRSEAHQHGNVGGVTAAGNDDAADPACVVPGVERVPRAAQIHLERVKQFAHGNSKRFALCTVNIQIQPRRIRARAVEEILKSFRTITAGNNLFGHPLQLPEAETIGTHSCGGDAIDCRCRLR